ncbi:uncharacterized protein LOC128983065 isoform X2 [Macrosteles quadrilineatus]|uniref:uncharacterized protein LOC128983065 isoform X2 n=1 Tax=Macrosteles quadrilineatus TaxID=74068 RepID=UPI0023E11EDD|nr:uncharacterized protein LOC128983065 isoform X2 [Macrosteles quadrilineatus]
MEDPAYIQSLFDINSNYSCYFCVGDPREGLVERIGVVPPMLMAHSLMFRRTLDIQRSEVKKKWDITVTDITPKAFRNVLRYAYGYNIVKNQSLPHSVELLALTDRWVMKAMSNDLANHISSLLTPINVCLAMTDPVCLRVKRVEDEIARLIKNNPMRVLNSPYIHRVCPAGMRYIVLLKSLKASDIDVWRTVMTWARSKVQKQKFVLAHSYQPEKYIHPKLLVPCGKFMRLCSLNMIDLVEEVLANHPDREQNIEAIIKYHYMNAKPSKSLYICTESKNAHHLKHEKFLVKVVPICDAWVDAVYLLSSTITVTNQLSSPIELFSIVCSGKQKLALDFKEAQELLSSSNPVLQSNHNDISYNASCSVKVNWTGKEESPVYEVKLDTDVAYGHDFQITLSSKDKSLRLQPCESYTIVTNFSKPHPLWYNLDRDQITPGQSNDLEMCCGLVDKERMYFGSHIKYILYRKCIEDKQC